MNSQFDPLVNQFAGMLASGPLNAATAPLDPDAPREDLVDRHPTEPEDAARAALVKQMCDVVREDRQYWDDLAFKRMRRDQKFAAGHQWPVQGRDEKFVDEAQERYVANIVLRHIQQRTATLYGKNPKVIARRRNRLLNKVWDGTARHLEESMQAVQQSMMMGVPDPVASAVLMDAKAVAETQRQLDRIAKTLELLFEHSIDEQVVPFKVQMKAMIRRALTTGVGYVKVGYQRIMDKTPEVQGRILDASEKLAALERMSADIADNVVPEDHHTAEQLRLLLQDLSNQDDVLVREGLVYSYPDSTSIIPDRNCTQLRGWVGADHVTEEYFLTREKIQEIYGVDVGSRGTAYASTCKGSNEFQPRPDMDNKGEQRFCVWEMYNRVDGMVYIMCDGYPEFLTEPAAPDVYLERFYPWFAFPVNEVYEPTAVFPPSDVQLLMDPQLEINRARQGLREHRRASRPKTITRAGALTEADRTSIVTAKANEVIELQGLQPGDRVDDFLQPWNGPNIQPALYDVSPAFEDVLRVVGQQEANLGGTSGATATESSIAEGSRASSASSTVDDLDEFLTEIARASGQILLLETSPDTVRQVVGPGAVWPDLTREEVAKEIYLEIEAASTGRPNRAQETQTAQQVYPLLLQIPGLNPEWLARELLRRMDDRLDLSDAFAAAMPSIQAMNRIGQMAGAGAPGDPNAQGAEGANNAPSTQPARPNVGARPDQAAQQVQQQQGQF